MRATRILLLCIAVPLLAPLSLPAQETDESLVQGFWHGTKYVSRLIVKNSAVKVGQNVGASAPLRIPQGVGIMSYAPKFAPVLALETEFFFWERFIVGIALQMEYKGMRTRSRVRNFYTEVVQEDQGSLMRVVGQFTGQNVTDVNLTYATMPLRLGFWVTPRVALKLGVYASYSVGRSFTGFVEQGYLWSIPQTPDGMSTKVLVDYADFDFSKHIRSWDWGGEFLTSMYISQRFFVDVGLSMGVASLMRSHFTGLPFRMHNVYAMLGLGYRFMGAPRALR